MRIFVGVVGGLFLLVALVAGVLGAGVIGTVETDQNWDCTSSTDGSTGTVKQSCSYDDEYNPTVHDRQLDEGLALVVGAAAVFVGGCALIGGAVAGGRKAQQQRSYAPQPVAAGGPPSYGSGWQGNQQPPAGNEPTRS